MWIRADLKANAKQSLKVNGYWVALAVIVIVGVLTGGLGGLNNTINGPRLEYRLDQSDLARMDDFSRSVSSVFAPFAVSLAILAIGYSIFVASPILVGKSRFFLEHRVRTSSVGTVFSPFMRKSYLNVVKSMLLTGLTIFLWSLLLIIPGIIKAYQYILVPYILAENPDIEWRRALALSRGMTDGCKFDIFVLQLSFFGWYLLGALALFVGTLFVAPYPEATMAELYAHLRGKAIARGLTSEGELPGVA
jgi:uncharacterized membrane protein